MNKCFAYYEKWKNGIRYAKCTALNNEAFTKVQRKRGGCSLENCPFYKENTDQVHTDFLYTMSDKKKAEQKMFYTLNYKGRPNIKY